MALTRGVNDDLAVWLPFAAMLIAVAGIDLDHRIIPNKILLPAAIWGLAATIAFRPDNVDDALIAGGIAFGALLLAALAYPAGMGMGDVKLAGVMGIYLGSSVAPAMLVAFITGSLVGLTDHRPRGARRPQEGRPVRPIPGGRRARRHLRRARARGCLCRPLSLGRNRRVHACPEAGGLFQACWTDDRCRE